MTPRGRALASSLAILGLAAGAGLWQYGAARPKPVVESRRIDGPAGPPAQGPIGPTAREALERKTELQLLEVQVQRLVVLDREWRETAGPLEAEAREAEAEFRRFMEDARREGRGNLAEIRRRAGEQGELLAAYRARRRAHVAAVRQVLTEEQRARWTATAAPQRTREER